MQRHAVPHVAQEIRGPTCADNFTVRACVGLSSCRDRERKTERRREGEKKKRCWVHDSCKPRGHTSPRLAPPLMTLVAPFLPLCHSTPVSVCLSFPRCNPLPPFGLVLHRESRQRCTGLTRREKGRSGEMGWRIKGETMASP